MQQVIAIARISPPRAAGDNSPRLIWMLFANPDTSTSYVEVAFRAGVVAISPRKRIGFRNCDRYATPIPIPRPNPMPRPMTACSPSLAAGRAAGPAAAGAQTAWHEGFEGPQTSWRDAGGDAQYRVLQHQRLQQDAHAGNGCEWLQIEGNGGSYVYFAHDVGRPRVIDELAPSVWIKSDRPGSQLAVRVVLPRTIDPRSGQPVATILAGASYTDVGRWQQLRLAGIPTPADPPDPRPADAARAASRRPRSLRRRRAAERLRRAGRRPTSGSTISRWPDTRPPSRAAAADRPHRRIQPPPRWMPVRLPPVRPTAHRGITLDAGSCQLRRRSIPLRADSRFRPAAHA